MMVLETIKGVLSPSDSTKTQLLHSVKEGNQWEETSQDNWGQQPFTTRLPNPTQCKITLNKILIETTVAFCQV